MKRFLQSLLILTALVAACVILNPTEAHAATIDDLTFTLNSNGNSYSVTDCNTSAAGDLTIPATYNGKPVTAIGNLAFNNCTSLTDITIPDCVNSIGNGSFSACTSLTSVTIPDSVTTIGVRAFFNCSSLTSVTIGNRITAIGDSVFASCSKLTSVAIPDSVTTIGTYAFDSCTSLTSITVPDSVTSIGNHAFYSCLSLSRVDITDISAWCRISCGFSGNSYNNPLYYGASLYLNGELLSNLIIPNDVTIIGGWAFYNCTGLTSVTIPDSVTSIGRGAFAGCSSLESITIPFVGDSKKSDTDTYQYPLGYIFGTSSFAGGTATRQYYYGSSTSSTTFAIYYIPASLKSVTVTGGNILYGAFENCDSLTSVTILDSVTTIGKSAFSGCSSLTGMTIPESVTTIGNSAFRNCESLTSVAIPDGVTTIGNSAFSGCSSLTSMTIPDSVATIGESALAGCSSLESITIPFVGDSRKSETDTYQYPLGYIFGSSSFEGCTATGQYYYASSISSTTFGNYYIPTSLKSVTVTDGNILRGAFYDCDRLSSVTIPDSVTSIGNYAFYDCDRLTSVTVPDSVTTIGNYAFYSCSGLTSVAIPDSVTTIGDSAFYSCSGLTSVTIPNSVTTIGENAFRYCSSLTSVDITDVSAWSRIKFHHNYSNPLYYAKNLYLNGELVTDLVIPEGTDIIEDHTFVSCTSLTSVTIGNGVTAIGENAFYGCAGLTAVTIPDSVITIYERAFSGCESLTDVYYASTRDQWDAIAIWRLNDPILNTTLHFTLCETNGHTEEIIPGKAATCTETGLADGKKCTVCDEVLIPQIVLPGGHLEVIIPGKAATCTEAGLTEGKKCSVCGEILVAQDKIPALGHTEEIIPGKAATCTDSGLTEGKKCSVCGEILLAQEEISATGHTEEILPSKDATLTDNGLTEGAKCSVCGEILVAQEEIPALLTFTLNSDGQGYTLSACATSVTGELTIPATYNDLPVTAVGQQAFRGCAKITAVTIPDGITAIGASAFSGCTGLKTINIPASVQKIGYAAFYNCSALSALTIPDGITDILYSTFSGCTGLTSVSIPDSVIRIGELAFDNCKSLASITIPDGVTTIGRAAFFNCISLESIQLPQAVTSLGDSAFYSCKGLTAITIPSSIACIEKSTFYDCTKLEEVVIEESVETIDEYAFYNCIALKIVTIPDSVTYIGSYAFDNCTALTDVYFSGTQEQWDALALSTSNAPLLNATLHLDGPCAQGHTYDHDFDTTCNLCDEVREVSGSFEFINYRVVFSDSDTTHKNLRVEVYKLGDKTVADPTDEKALKAIDASPVTHWNAGNINKILITDAGNYVLLLKYNIGTGSAIKVPLQISVSADPKLVIDKNNKLTAIDNDGANINHRVVVYYLGDQTVENIYDETALTAIDSAPETVWQKTRINKLALTKGGNYVLHLCYNVGTGNKITVAQQFAVESIPTLTVNLNNMLIATEENAENRNHRAVVYYLGENVVEDPYSESAVTAAAVTTSKTYWGLTEINALELKEGGNYVIHLYYNVGTSEKRTLALDVTLNERPTLSLREDNRLVVSYSDPDITNPRAYIYKVDDATVTDIYDEAALKAIATPTQVWGLSSILQKQLTEPGTYVIHFYYSVGTSAKKTVALKVTI